jgi:hypothetical protein
MRLAAYCIPVVLGLAMATPSFDASAQISVGVSITARVPPPLLPVYSQPPIPGPGYLWTPGYWDYEESNGYYWVPGTWVLPPRPGLLWTPGYWGFEGGVYGFHAGYWGLHVGFYGGINYGFGYGGFGFQGGFWRGGEFHYNSAVTNISDTHITNVYNKTVINKNTSHASFNGAGGTHAKPTRRQEAAARDEQVGRTPEQENHARAARGETSLRASENRGRPEIAATRRPGEFRGPDVVRAREAGRDEHERAERRERAERHPEERR